MIRAAVRQIEPYRPGMSVAEVRARVLGLQRVVKLGSNELALPPLRAAVARATEATCGTNRYPDPWCTELREALAARHGVAPEQVVPGNGADELIRLVCQATIEPGRSCVLPWPGYPTHAQGTLAAGGQAIAVSMPVDQLDPERLLDAIDENTSLLCLANPNNPTGAHAPETAIVELLDRLPSGVLCLLDEAYFGFVDPKLAGDAPILVADGRRNLCVVRTFSKAYGLAGFRVGYAVADARVADGINRIRTMFNVNQPGQAAALASLARQSEVDARCASLRARRDELASILNETVGAVVYPSQGNFVYCEVVDGRGAASSEGADALVDRLLREGIIVRRMRSFGAPGIRITVGAPSELRFLQQALSHIASEPKP